jgi:hypothetical protein
MVELWVDFEDMKGFFVGEKHITLLVFVAGFWLHM